LRAVAFSPGGDGGRKLPDDRTPQRSKTRHRREIDEKLGKLVRLRAGLRAGITLQQRSRSPDAAKIADYQRRIQELEAMMDRLLNPTASQ